MANDWQALHEDALDLLLDLNVPSAVTLLFSTLLGNVIEKSSYLDKRHVAETAAARLEALHDGKVPLPVWRVAKEYARVLDSKPDNCRRTIERLREDDRYHAKIRAIRQERD